MESLLVIRVIKFDTRVKLVINLDVLHSAMHIHDFDTLYDGFVEVVVLVVGLE